MITEVRVERRRLANGPADVMVAWADELEPLRLSAPARVRAREIAHLLGRRYGRRVTAVALPPVSWRAAGLDQRRGGDGTELLLSMRSALASRLFEPDESLASQADDAVIREAFRALERRGRVARVEYGPRDAEPLTVAVGALGFPRQAGGARPESLIVNSHYFLLEAIDVDSVHAAIGDTVGLLAAGGTIVSPPLAPRAALLLEERGWRAARPGLADLEIELPDEHLVRAGGAARFFCRGPALAGVRTPLEAGRLELGLVGRWPTSMREGGGLSVPHGGLVLSWAREDAPTQALRAVRAGGRVSYRLPAHPGLRAAIQGGPMLVAGGQVVLEDASFEREGFFVSTEHAFPNAPTVFPADASRTPAARMAAGVLADGRLVVVGVAGSPTGAATPDARSAGCTLLELAELMLEAGAVDAINLDGGGSTQAFLGSGALLTPADTRGLPGASFERPVPVALRLGRSGRRAM